MSQTMVPLPPDHGRIRTFFRQQTHSIISHPVCAWFFAGFIACCLGVWFSSGEMFIVIPVLALGWVFAAVAWWWAPNLSKVARILWIVVSIFPLTAEGFLKGYFHPLKTQNIASSWNSLSKNSRKRLTAALKAISGKPITIACVNPNCKELSDDFVSAFLSAGWPPQVHHGGGLGIDGRVGLFIDPNEPTTQRLRLAIQGTTDLKVEIGPDSRKVFGPGPIFFVIGIKPF